MQAEMFGAFPAESATATSDVSLLRYFFLLKINTLIGCGAAAPE
jgi:hypothetical protein